MGKKHFNTTLALIYFIAIFSPQLYSQEAPVDTIEYIDAGKPDFEFSYINPYMLMDTLNALSIDSFAAGKYDDRLLKAESPFLTFGRSPASWWLRFDLKNTTNKPQTRMLWFSRRNFDYLSLWQSVGKRDSISKLEDVGVAVHNATKFLLSNGYYVPVTLQPGMNYCYIKTWNKTGSLYLTISLYTPSEFASYNRWNVFIFGLFAGVIILSVLFGLQLFFVYRDQVYIFYVAYILAIMLREMYNFAIGFPLTSSMQRHCVSFLLVSTFGLFLRYFLRTWEFSRSLDNIIKWSTGFFLIIIPFYSMLLTQEQHTISKFMFRVLSMSSLFFIVLTAYFTITRFSYDQRSRIVALAFIPLGTAFFLNLMRNLNLIPNLPLLQYAVMIGFMFEIIIFTTVFTRFYRTLENERQVLELKLAVEQQQNALSIQAAEQKVKDQIARDLHDDVAASLSGIRILSKVAIEQFSSKLPSSAPLLEQINQNAHSTLESISDLIWTLRATSDHLNGLADRMRSYANRTLEAKGIEVNWKVPRDLLNVEMDIESRRNIYLIFKEAVNNTIAHSSATQMDIELKIDDNQILTVRLEDNGSGFNTEEKLQGIGTGLNNMARRARDIQAELIIDSAEGKGCVITLKTSIESVA
ncbi:MAG: hypothetical protein IT269_14625 [Saprospiraceae bacterium]|nr:hypothetical protein [Saprospiraceae bacterium]